MPYIHENKETKELRAFGSIKALSKVFNIPIDNLYTIFSRKRKKVYENDYYRIVKTKIERA